jgi:hypothetical protein
VIIYPSFVLLRNVFFIASTRSKYDPTRRIRTIKYVSGGRTNPRVGPSGLNGNPIATPTSAIHVSSN